jgi:hypothetical protein
MATLNAPGATGLSGFNLTGALPKAVATYFESWVPDKDQRQWMKGGASPLWPFVAPAVLDAAYPVADHQVAALSERLIEDSIARFGYADLFTPEFTALSALRPDWPFNWLDPETGAPLQTWRIAPQETTIGHLRWLFCDQGVVQAGTLAAINFLAYYVHGWIDPVAVQAGKANAAILNDPLHALSPKNPSNWYGAAYADKPAEWSYLRNGGDPKLIMGDAGRARMARGTVDYPHHLLAITARAGLGESPSATFLRGVRLARLEQINANFPLVDNPKGDHLIGADGIAKHFISNYQYGTLFSICKDVVEDEESGKCGPYDGEAVAIARNLMFRIAKLVVKYGSHKSGTPGSFYYDTLMVKDAAGEWVAGYDAGMEAPNKVNVGIGGVNQWTVDLLSWSAVHFSGELAEKAAAHYDALKADALKLGWPDSKPAFMAQYFGVAK